MGDFNDHVVVNITKDSVGIARAGFGVPMVLSANATFPERIRYYSSAAGVGDDFAQDSPEILAADAIFGQQPKPARMAIGRSTLPPTMVYVIGVATIRNSHAYKIQVHGQGVTATEVAITSGSSATNDAIVASLVSALNGVTGKNYTAAATGSAGSQVVTITGNVAGAWFSLEVEDISDLSNKMTHSDPGVATDLAAILVADKGWYALYTLYNSKQYVLGAAAWANANQRIYVPDVCETDAVILAVSGGDTIDALHTLAYSRVMGAYHPAPNQMFAAAWYGRVLPIDPGSETWKWKTLQGVETVNLTTTQRLNLTNKKGNSYELLGNFATTFEGTTSDGDFMDMQRGLDWLINDITVRVIETLASGDKVPYEDSGISGVKAAVRASLKEGVRRKILAANPVPVVTAPLVADIDLADIAARVLPDVKFSATRSGAIHKAIIDGTISL